MILFNCKVKVPKHGILKNSKQILLNKKTGARFISSSNDAKMAENWLLRCLMAERFKRNLNEPIKEDVNICYKFYFPKTIYFTKAGPRSSRIGDLDNLIALPQDCLQKAGILSNDSFVCSLDGSRRVPSDSTDYFLEIIISKFQN